MRALEEIGRKILLDYVRGNAHFIYISLLKIQQISISFVYTNPTFLKAVQDQLFVILQGYLTIFVGVGHLHPTGYIFGFWVEIYPHLLVGFFQKFRNLLLTKVAVLVLIEL